MASMSSPRAYPDPRCRALITFYFAETSAPECSLEALETRTKLWFFRNSATDEAIREAFAEDVQRALGGELEDWNSTAVGWLGLVVLVDQFPRNLHRDSPLAFANDPLGLRIGLEGLARGYDQELSAGERLVSYLPLMHAEDRAIQAQSTELYRRLAETAPVALQPELASAYRFAARHREIIDRFGRFPHRNTVLGRASTEDELAFLQEPNSSF